MNKIKQKKGFHLVKKIFKLLPSLDTFRNDTSTKDHRSLNIEKQTPVNFGSNNVHRSYVLRQAVAPVNKAQKNGTEKIRKIQEYKVKACGEGKAVKSDRLETEEAEDEDLKELRERQEKVDKKRELRGDKKLSVKEDKEFYFEESTEEEIKKSDGHVHEAKEQPLNKIKECEVKETTGRKIRELQEEDMEIVMANREISVRTNEMRETKEKGKLESISIIQKDNYICIAKKDEFHPVPMPMLRNPQDGLTAKQEHVNDCLNVCPTSKTIVINSYDFRVPAPGIRYIVPCNMNHDQLNLQVQIPFHDIPDYDVETISETELEGSFSFSFPTIRQPKIFRIASHHIINCVKKVFSGDKQERKPFACVKYKQMVVKDLNDNEATIFQYYESSAKKSRLDSQSQYFLSFLQTFDDPIPDIPYSTTTFSTIVSFRKTNDSFSCDTNVSKISTCSMSWPFSIPSDLSLLHWSSFSYDSQSIEGSLRNNYVEDEDPFVLLLNKDVMAPIDILCKALQNTVPHIWYEEKTKVYTNDVCKCKEPDLF